MSLKLLTITLILSLSLLAFIGSLERIESVEIESNEVIPHKDLAIGYVIGRDGSITAMVGLNSFTITIPELSNRFWVSVDKTIVSENITTIDYINGAHTALLTLNLTENFLIFDIEGRLPSANLLSFQFSENTIRLEENRTGLRLANGGLFYFDWTDIQLETEFIEGSKVLRIDIRSSPNFKLDPRLVFTNPDFETGDFTGWTTACSGGNTQAVSSIDPINGSESNRVVFTSDSNCLTRQSTFSSNTDTFYQHTWRLESNGSVTDGDRRDISRMTSSSQLRLRISMEYNATRGAFQFAVGYRDNGGAIPAPRNQSFPNIINGATYCIEAYYQRDDSDPDMGIVQVWINNTQLMNIEDVDNESISRPNRIWLGQQGTEVGGDVTYRVDDLYGANGNSGLADRINTCPEGLGEEEDPGPPVVGPLVLSTLAPIGPNIMLLFIIIGLIALGQTNPWFVMGGWVAMSIAFGMSLSPAYVALDANNNPVTFIQAFPPSWSVWLFRFFIIMSFIYPIRILVLVYERLITVTSSLRNRLG